MRTSLFLFAIILGIVSSTILSAQTSMPTRVFRDTPKTHNMHIASDGQFLYTCNGGRPDDGQVSKFTPDGELVGSYPIELDMRSIFYNSSDHKLYVSTFDKDIYKITDLVMGVYSLALHIEDRDGQCTPAISPDGKLLYFLENDDVFIYKMKDGSFKKKISGFSTAEGALSEATTMAVDSKHIYTWNYDEQKVLAFDLKGKFIKSFKLNQGDYSFSLSAANGLIWVSKDGNYETGTWYGYNLADQL
jgi:6-phosphogluconolactonase (cycloisomerase 2 family)